MAQWFPESDALARQIRRLAQHGALPHAALLSGRLSGCGLDVTDPEPLPPEHPLWRIPSAVITPHVSGFFHLRETYENIMALAYDNLEAYLTGAPLKNEVDFSTGYRKAKEGK